MEFFIRDKYEKRIYYSKNVTNGSSVCTGSRSKFFYKCCSYSLLHPEVFVCLQPKDAKKERERDSDRGSKVSSHSKVA